MTVTRRVPRMWGKGREPGHWPYLLIESDDPAWAVSDFTAFVEAGFIPAFCAGHDAKHPCPLLQGDRCELLDEADVVLHRIRKSDGMADLIHRSRPNVPVLIVGPGPGDELPLTAPIETQTRTLRSVVLAARFTDLRP